MKQHIRQHNILNLIIIPVAYVLGIFAKTKNYEVTGTVLIIAASYFIVSLIFFKTNTLPETSKWLKYDRKILFGFASLLSFFGMIESRPNFILILVFAELLVFLYVYAYFAFRNRNKPANSENIIQKWGIIRFCFRMFFIAVTVLLLLSVFNEYSPSSKYLDPYYFILLFVFLTEWLISHITNTVRLKNEQTQAELLHLRSQLNPHFFFNTLNNLYALTIKNSKQAPEVILKLSEMMRYTIYEGEKSNVTIKDEITYLENYIELHKIRYKKSVSIQFNHAIDENLSITPLLFINLLENAFKHGVDTLTENAFIKMELTNDADFIYFSIENNFDKKENNQTKGIGLTNLKRRLSLLYPKTHQLEFTQQSDIYKVTLKVPV
ncbi:histidine kinase [uncultured Kordia sp.]|uniref:sensor histidine kinase n=1 Tax=uncultured Kordia sp. TaxID=507699 RepID=UPI0026130CB0|nr:histidine kinase [uncultured Kordia sp.]